MRAASGGALGIGVADRILMMENAYYSVISPEGCAAILWKHRKHAPEAAEAMSLTAPDLAELGLVDEVVPEPEGGAHRDHQAAAANLGAALVRQLDELCGLPVEELLERRYDEVPQSASGVDGSCSRGLVRVSDGERRRRCGVEPVGERGRRACRGPGEPSRMAGRLAGWLRRVAVGVHEQVGIGGCRAGACRGRRSRCRRRSGGDAAEGLAALVLAGWRKWPENEKQAPRSREVGGPFRADPP